MIILTGSNGFIGKNFLNNIHDDIIQIEKENCFDFLKDFDKWDKVSLILHQGAISFTTEKDINILHKYNVDFTLKLFSQAIKHHIPVKYASSASVYGNENKIYNPLNYYAITKLQIDYFVLDNIDKFSNIQGFRYFNVYGKHEDYKVKVNQSSPVSKFINEIKETGKLKLFKNSENFFRDFICVDDIVDIVMNNTVSNGIYDLGTGNPISFQDIANLVIKKEGGSIEYIPFPEKLIGKYQTYTCADMKWLKNYKFKTIGEYLNLL
jgi:ADP-L-glycero-D-manno-heptose 6-epimerase